MSKPAGVKFERDIKGKIKKVTLDMKMHAGFLEDYLDHLKIEEAKKDAEFIPWEVVKNEIHKLHELKLKKIRIRKEDDL